MKTLAQVRRQLSSGQFEFTRHAFRRAVERNISEREIYEASLAAELIEDYPDDKYAPSALLLGFSTAGRALHFQVTFSDNDLVRIITIYEPDPAEWIEYRSGGKSMFLCHVCGFTTSREDFVSEVFTIDGRRVLVEHIPAQVCERCSEATFSRTTTERVRSLIYGGGTPIRTVPLDVFALV